MSIETELKKDGIEVTEELDTLTINAIAKKVANKICQTFPEYGLEESNLFTRIARLDMYKAKRPERNE